MTDVVTKVSIGGQVYPFGQVDTSVAAEDVSYDNTTSSMTATNVQDAIDEIIETGIGGDIAYAPTSPYKPKYHWVGTQAQYDALSQYYTDEPNDTIYMTI